MFQILARSAVEKANASHKILRLSVATVYVLASLVLNWRENNVSKVKILQR